MFPDMNRDGKKDMREYYDDLGGAYYFRPPGLDKPFRWGFWLREKSQAIDFIFWLIILTILFLL